MKMNVQSITKTEFCMNDHEYILDLLQRYEPDELYYRAYHHADKAGRAAEFLNKTIPDNPEWKNHVLYPETINPEMDEEMFFRKGRNAAVVKHPRCLPVFRHRHTFFEIHYVLSGVCQDILSDRTLVINEGECCMIAPGVKHAVSVFDDSVVLNLLIRSSTFLDIFQNAISSDSQISLFFLGSLYDRKKPNYLIYHTGYDMQLRDYVLDMAAEELNADIYTDRILCSLLTVFFCQLGRRYSETVETPAAYGKTSSLSDEILDYIMKNYAEVSIRSLAEHFHFSEPYCSKLVKEASGSTFSQLLTSIRMRRSENLLLNTRLSVEEISDQIGYKNPESFIRCFKRIYQVSPSQFRRNS